MTLLATSTGGGTKFDFTAIGGYDRCVNDCVVLCASGYGLDRVDVCLQVCYSLSMYIRHGIISWKGKSKVAGFLLYAPSVPIRLARSFAVGFVGGALSLLHPTFEDFW